MNAATIDVLAEIAEILAAPATKYEIMLPARPATPVRIALRAAADLEPILRHSGGLEVWRHAHHVARRLRDHADELDAATAVMAEVWSRPTLGELRRREVTP